MSLQICRSQGQRSPFSERASRQRPLLVSIYLLESFTLLSSGQNKPTIEDKLDLSEAAKGDCFVLIIKLLGNYHQNGISMCLVAS